MTELTSAVREAQADADRRFGDGPVQPWEPPPVLSESTRRRLAVVALASALATAVLVAIAVAKTAPPVDPLPVQPLPSAPEAVFDDDVPQQDAPPSGPAPVISAPSFALERRGAHWHLSSQGLERQSVMQRLAEASGATLHGWPDAAAASRPVQLQWQGRSLAQLWPLVLGPELNFALQCRGERCEVWILAPARPGAAPMVSSLPSVSLEPAVLPLPMPGLDQDSVPIRD